MKNRKSIFFRITLAEKIRNENIKHCTVNYNDYYIILQN